MSLKQEDAIGEVDGVNDEFETSIGYVPGSLDTFVDGILEKDAHTELGGKLFRMNEIPLVGEILRVIYLY